MHCDTENSTENNTLENLFLSMEFKSLDIIILLFWNMGDDKIWTFFFIPDIKNVWYT